MKILIAISFALLLVQNLNYCEQNNSSDIFETDKIVIYHVPFYLKLRRGIRYTEIEQRCTHIININNPSESFLPFTSSLKLKEELSSLTYLNDIDLNQLVVRTKIIFSFKNTKEKYIIYLLEDKTVLVNNRRYTESSSILKLLDLI